MISLVCSVHDSEFIIASAPQLKANGGVGRRQLMNRSNRSNAFLSLILLGSIGLPDSIRTNAANPPALVQDYPAKSVRIVEPFGAGGGPDLVARALAKPLSELWGKPVTVENITGAGATAAPARVAKSPADGYTLLINTSAQAYSAAFLKNLPYDPLRDFVPVIPLTSQPYVLVVGKSAGIATVGELIAAAKAKPGAIKFGSTGVGTGTHVGVVKFNLEAGMKVMYVPPKPTDGIAEVINSTVEGRTTYVMAPISFALPRIREGKLVALGLTTMRRSALLPAVPTIAEAGVAGFDFPIWYGVWVPKGTPAGVVNKLAKDIAGVLATQDMRNWVATHGGEPMRMTQTEFARFVRSESKSAAQIIKAAEGQLRQRP
jgi:tripartite-type tricarboxylate transporter receptor subunit TctC